MCVYEWHVMMYLKMRIHSWVRMTLKWLIFVMIVIHIELSSENIWAVFLWNRHLEREKNQLMSHMTSNHSFWCFVMIMRHSILIRENTGAVFQWNGHLEREKNPLMSPITFKSLLMTIFDDYDDLEALNSHKISLERERERERERGKRERERTWTNEANVFADFLSLSCAWFFSKSLKLFVILLRFDIFQKSLLSLSLSLSLSHFL